MAYNIASQNENGALAGLMSAFDLPSMEEYDSRAQKISQFFDLYGLDTDHEADEWYGFKVKLLWKNVWIVQRINFWNNSRKLLCAMNAMARHLKDNKKLTQVKKFKMSRVIKSSYKRCYIFNISFLVQVLK